MSELPATISETTTARRIILTTSRASSTPVMRMLIADDDAADADDSHNQHLNCRSARPTISIRRPKQLELGLYAVLKLEIQIISNVISLS